MTRVLVLKPLRDHALDLLTRRGLDLIRIDAPTEDAVLDAIAHADVLCVKNTLITAQMLDRAVRLRFVSKHGVGLDNLPLTALTARDIPVATTGDANSGPVAEHAMALMLALARRLPQYDARARAGGYITDPAWPTWSLAGKNLLLVGLGRIGTRVAALAQAFGMGVSAVDPVAPPCPGVARETDLTAALGEADFVSLHCPLTKATAHIADAAFFAAMKPAAFLINTGRGELVDEAALLAALETGGLAGAGLDVFESEPPDPANPLFASDRIIVTPHTAALTEDSANEMSRVTAQNVLDWLDRTPEPSRIANPEILK